MKKYQATISFTGAISMIQNEIKEVADDIADDLVFCGFLREVEQPLHNSKTQITQAPTAQNTQAKITQDSQTAVPPAKPRRNKKNKG